LNTLFCEISRYPASLHVSVVGFVMPWWTGKFSWRNERSIFAFHRESFRGWNRL